LREGSATSPGRGEGEEDGGVKVQGEQQRRQGRTRRRLDCSLLPLFSSFLCNTVHLDQNPVCSEQRNPKNTKRSPHPTHAAFFFFTSQPMSSKCFRHTGMHPPSPSLHRSTGSLERKECTHIRGRGLACFARGEALARRPGRRDESVQHLASQQSLDRCDRILTTIPTWTNPTKDIET